MTMMASGSMAAPEGKPDLEQVDIHDVLSNERRQLTLQLLKENGDMMTGRELSERIAELETGENPPPRNIRQSVYVSLHQTHLPKLDKLDIVDYDASSKTVQLNEGAKQVASYMNAAPLRVRPEYYLVLSLLALGLLGGSQIGVPLIQSVPPALIAGPFLVIMSVLAGYHSWSVS